MRRPLLASVIAVTLLSAASAQDNCVSVPLLNPGFEDDVLSCTPGYYCDSAGASGWLVGTGTSVFKPSTSQFPGGVPEGVNVVALGYSAVTGSILQVAPAVVRANTAYTLKLAVGARADNPFTGYVAKLMAANVTLASDNSLSPAPGTFQTDVIVYRTGANPVQYGQPLTIFVKSFGTGQADIDDVSLTACSLAP
jgi:hypothetical protein